MKRKYDKQMYLIALAGLAFVVIDHLSSPPTPAPPPAITITNTNTVRVNAAAMAVATPASASFIVEGNRLDPGEPVPQDVSSRPEPLAPAADLRSLGGDLDNTPDVRQNGTTYSLEPGAVRPTSARELTFNPTQ